MDADARRLRDRDRKRAYRARKREEAESAASSVPEQAPLPLGEIEQDVVAAIGTMKQLAPSDSAICSLARRTARQIDGLIAADPVGNATRIFSGINTLTRILHELGGTPTVRQQYEFRSRKLAGQEQADADSEQPAGAGGNVTRIRPAKRRPA